MANFHRSLLVCGCPRLMFVLIAALSFTANICHSADPPAPTSSPNQAPVCLPTEFFPGPEIPRWIQERLPREICRQALLIAARDGLGLSTRDETLGEPFPERADGVPASVELEVRATRDNVCDLRLLRKPEEGDAAADREELWAQQYQYTTAINSTYVTLVTVMESASRSDLIEALRAAGYDGQPSPEVSDGALPAGVERLLAKMDFVSQYMAVRKTHAAIAEDGQSMARLGVLARGYAHLAALTRHYWASMNDAFAARALLYAERMVATANNDDTKSLARWHRAYARAVIGLHAVALEEIAELSSTPGKPDESDAAEQPVPSTDALPSWTRLIDPLCRFRYDDLLALAADPALRQLVHHLAYDVKSAYGVKRWNVEAGKLAVQECPESYGLYTRMADDTPMLVERHAVRLAPHVFGRQLPKRIALMEPVPEPVAEQVKGHRGPRNSWLATLLDGQSSDESFSTLPSELAAALIAAARDPGDAAEPSWAVLGQMIAEEQFVQIANLLGSAMNAVEYSKEGMVAEWSPLVEGHRYAPFIESYRFNRQRQTQELKDLVRKMRIVDPRGNMKNMLYCCWQAYDQRGQCGGSLAYHALWNGNYTYPDLKESIGNLDGWFQQTAMSYLQSRAANVRYVSPHSPLALRLEFKTTVNPDLEKLAEWEPLAQDDPIALRNIASLYYKRWQFEPAIRCYSRAYDLSPSYDAIVGLATAYRYGGQKDKWRPTLERYLEVEDNSLGHAKIHQLIANDYIENGQWAEAEPHALQAAQTWSGWGLILASRVYEGLGRWDESERWIRAAVENYPTYSGHEWYFWCQRTGRGDVETARKFFADFLQLDWVQKRQRNENYVFVDHMIAGRYPQALEEIQGLDDYATDVYWQLHAILLAKRLGNDELYAESMEKLMKSADKRYRESDPNLHSLIVKMRELQEKGTWSDHDFQAVDKLFDDYGPISRANYCYFVGEQLALHGDAEHAEKYWRRSLASGQFQKYNATFAGQRLAELHGTSGPDEVAQPAGEVDDEASSDDQP